MIEDLESLENKDDEPKENQWGNYPKPKESKENLIRVIMNLYETKGKKKPYTIIEMNEDSRNELVRIAKQHIRDIEERKKITFIDKVYGLTIKTNNELDYAKFKFKLIGEQ